MSTRNSFTASPALSASPTNSPVRVIPGASDPLFDAAEGYDLAADAYDKWQWQHFWCQNETPRVAEALASSTRGEALDVGAGTGRYLKVLRDLGYDAQGIDVSRRMLEKAADYLGSSRGLMVADLRAVPLPARSFDLLTCCRVLSHVDNIGMALLEFHRLVRPRGRVVIADVDSRHDYVATRIPVGAQNIFVKVYKHSLQELARNALATGFRVVTSQSFSAKELSWRPPVQAFPAIDWSGRRPVFSVLVLERVL